MVRLRATDAPRLAAWQTVVVTLVVLATVTAVVLAVVCRGRPRTFVRPAIRRLGLVGIAVVSLITSSLSQSTGVYAGWLVVGVLALVWFGLLNRDRPGIGLVLGGLLLNVVVIFLNSGMPVSVAALERAGVPASRVTFDDAWGESRPAGKPLREELTSQTILPWLGEAVPLALPVRPAVASPGDVLVAAGAALFLFTGLTGLGRTVPDRQLTKAERKAHQVAKKEGLEADAATGEDRFTVPAIGSGITATEAVHARDDTPAVVGAGAAVPPDGLDQHAVHDADADEPGGEPALDPAAAAAAAAAAEVAARAEAQRRELKQQIKKMKHQKKQLQRLAAAQAAAASPAPEPDEPATTPTASVTAANGAPPGWAGLTVVPPVSADDDDDDEAEADEAVEGGTGSRGEGRGRLSTGESDDRDGSDAPVVRPSNDRLA